MTSNNANSLFVTPTTSADAARPNSVHGGWPTPHNLTPFQFKFGEAGLDANVQIGLGDLVWVFGPCGSGTTCLLSGLAAHSLKGSQRVGLIYEDEKVWISGLRKVARTGGHLFATQGGDVTLCVQHIARHIDPHLIVVDCPLVREDSRTSAATVLDLKELAVKYQTVIAFASRSMKAPKGATFESTPNISYGPGRAVDTMIKLSQGTAEVVKSRHTRPGYKGKMDLKAIKEVVFPTDTENLSRKHEAVRIFLSKILHPHRTSKDFEQMQSRAGRPG